MSDHEYFHELSARAAIGQLSTDEDRELSEHLTECEICREEGDDYSHIIRRRLPQLDAIRPRKKLAISELVSDAELRDRFLARARAEGMDFSADVEDPSRPHHSDSSSTWWTWGWQSAVALGTFAVVAFVGSWFFRTYELVRHNSILDIRQQAHENEDLRTQLVTRGQTSELDLAQLSRIRKQNSLSEESLRKLQRQAQEAQTQTERLSTELQVANSEKTRLLDANQWRDTAIAELRAQIDELNRQQAENQSELVARESRIRDLTESLEQETMNLERERQLTSVSKEVRQLMGARNLHIMDVHDVNGDRRSAKAFGRLFYAEGQSLIFYAFDLPNGGLTPTKYSFHAWGQREVDSQWPRNLGTFEVDDHDQRRWVLKVSDSALLAGIDSVFVTAESLHDPKQPHGKKLLYAYVAGQPNHP
jgi:hypothetical protein